MLFFSAPALVVAYAEKNRSLGDIDDDFGRGLQNKTSEQGFQYGCEFGTNAVGVLKLRKP